MDVYIDALGAAIPAWENEVESSPLITVRGAVTEITDNWGAALHPLKS